MALLASQCRSRIFLSGLLTRSSFLSQKIPERKVAIRSQQFPEYSLIFDFDKIKTAGRINRTKLQATCLSVGGLPILYIGQTLGYVTPNLFANLAFYGFAVTVFLHSISFLFNNAIGYIYIKDDHKTVKISHVGYWGERVDVDTTIDDIYAFSDIPSRFNNPWYQRVRLMKSNKTYKLYLTAGKVLDTDQFDGIFGKVY